MNDRAQIISDRVFEGADKIAQHNRDFGSGPKTALEVLDVLIRRELGPCSDCGIANYLHDVRCD